MSKFFCRVRSKAHASKLETLTIEAPDFDEAVSRLQKDNFLIVAMESEEIARQRAKNSFSGRVLGVLSGQAFSRKLRGKAEGEELKIVLPDELKKTKISPFQIFPHVGTRELISFAIQLSTLIQAGVPLIRSLQIVKRGTRNVYFQTVLERAIASVSQGFSLGYAVSQYPKVFPPVWIHLIEVGEASGKLVEVLQEVARYQESAQRIKSKVISALFYPAVLIVFATGAVSFMMLKIIPKFEEIFKSMNIHLPLITKWVIFASMILKNYFPILAAAAALLVMGILLSLRTKIGRFIFDLIRLKTPIMGGLLLQVSVIRFSRSLATLIRAGIPILKAIEISAKLTDNAVLQQNLMEVKDAVQGGHTLGAQLETRNMFPIFMTQLVTVGEEAGELDRFLELISNFYEERVDTFLSRLSTLLEPLLLIFMGFIIGTIVIALFLPIVEISTGGH